MKVYLSRLLCILRWLILRMLVRRRQVTAGTPCLMILPCDPWHVVGSRGDEAMLTAIVQDFRQRNPSGNVKILVARPEFCSSADGVRVAREIGAEYISGWRGKSELSAIRALICAHGVSEMYVLGADCMDGYWSFYISFLLLAVADIAAAMGIRTRLTGFSLNEHPNAMIMRLLRMVSKRLTLLVRDPVSYRRLMEWGGFAGRAKLVSDVAFCLTPQFSGRVARILEDFHVEHCKGRFVLGFNLHAMLVQKERLDAFIDEVSAALNKFLSRNGAVSLFLIPHDYRDGGDLEVLAKLSARVPGARLIDVVLSAAELKAVTSGLDAIFTSRMHLGIAALGEGKPIGGFVYQGKFAGLLQHFGLGDESLLTPSESSRLEFALSLLMEKAAGLSTSIGEALPKVLSCARQNLIHED